MIPAATEYHWTPLADDADSESHAHRHDRDGLHYGAEAIDMFGGADWSPVRDVRVQNWHDVQLDATGDAQPGGPFRR